MITVQRTIIQLVWVIDRVEKITGYSCENKMD